MGCAASKEKPEEAVEKPFDGVIPEPDPAEVAARQQADAERTAAEQVLLDFRRWAQPLAVCRHLLLRQR